MLEVIDEVCDSLKNAMMRKSITVIRPNVESSPILATKPYVYSVFHNIIENAVKYSDMNKSERIIRIALSESGGYYSASITDNGIGIDMEAASGKVFQMYQRFNNTHPGHGFGLFLVKSQMEAMGGKIELDSILGQGTTFTLYFPKR